MKKSKRFNKAFGIAIRERRLSLGKSQETLSLDAELDRTYVSLLELGQRSPTLDTMMSLSGALDISFPDLALRFQEILETTPDD